MNFTNKQISVFRTHKIHHSAAQGTFSVSENKLPKQQVTLGTLGDRQLILIGNCMKFFNFPKRCWADGRVYTIEYINILINIRL